MGPGLGHERMLGRQQGAGDGQAAAVGLRAVEDVRRLRLGLKSQGGPGAEAGGLVRAEGVAQVAQGGRGVPVDLVGVVLLAVLQVVQAVLAVAELALGVQVHVA